MRIGLIIYGSLDTLTGGYLYDRMLVEHLRRQGDEVEIISLPWRTYRRHLADNFSLELCRRLRLAPVDALLQDELNHPSLVWLNWRLRRSVRYPIVSIVHLLRCSEPRPAWQNRLYRWVEAWYLRGVDGLIFNSQTTRIMVETLVGLNHPAVVAYPGRDHLPPTLTPAQIEARARRPGPLRVLFVGNVTPVKGLHILLRALAQLPSDTCCLTVVGSLAMDPIYVRRIRQQIAESGLTDRIRLLGACPNAEVAMHLTQSQVLAVPSLYEAFGIAYLEAMGFGLPVIASSAGAAHELIADTKHGFLIAPGDAATLAQHLHTLQQDRDGLRRMSLAAYQRAQLHPTWAESVARVRGLLQSLAR
ncbi:MAG TPA: glycosyltransferase family 4 protein [Candidatus Tectomicrobia bacterium]|nr:glycosyltransferase family 4 protein [Candidatus Tectomicrobia bacterium]